MRELGLFGLCIPEGVWRPGADHGRRSAGGDGDGLCPRPPSARWSAPTTASARRASSSTAREQKSAWLPRLATGEIIGSFALTEPDSGSDAASLRTTAVRDGDDYIINGTKRFITNAPEAGVFTVMARTESRRKGAGAISAFIVERGTPGLSLGKIDKKMGQRGAHTCDVIFENCRVPAANLIGGKEGVGSRPR
jgi:acyl-CoA dehydrogenase